MHFIYFVLDFKIPNHQKMSIISISAVVSLCVALPNEINLVLLFSFMLVYFFKGFLNIFQTALVGVLECCDDERHKLLKEDVRNVGVERN